jgi:hypothetical protein
MKLHTIESRINQIIEGIKGLALTTGMVAVMAWAMITFGM